MPEAALTPQDLEAALDLVQRVGEAETRDEFIALTLTASRHTVPCAMATVNEVDPSVGRFVYWYEPESLFVPPNAQELLSSLADEHPLISYIARTGDGSARTFSDLVTRQQLHATRLYEELYRPMGVEYQMSVTLPAEAPLIFALVLSDGEVDFTGRDRAVLNRVRPHLAHIWRNLRDLERMRALAGIGRQAVVDHGWGVIALWDPPEELTPGSLDDLYRHFGPPGPRSPLPAPVAKWIEDERAPQRVGGPLDLPRPLAVQTDGGRVVLRYLPAGRDHPDAIMVGRPAPTGSAHLEALGLTEREAQVVDLLITGASNNDIGGRLHISAGTVRKHTDNVYRKLGVHSRSALAAFVFDVSGG
jgi:DNA-binding CsgD family transcriptional regulator